MYWIVVENKGLGGGRVIQRPVLYLGEISSSQAEARRKAIEVFDEDAGRSRTLALFPEDRCTLAGADDVIRLRLSEMRLCRPRQWGACWLACGARPATRPLLGPTPAEKPQGYTLGTTCCTCWSLTGSSRRPPGS